MCIFYCVNACLDFDPALNMLPLGVSTPLKPKRRKALEGTLACARAWFMLILFANWVLLYIL